MNDMSMVILAKSDQLSADDLLAGPITITITNVAVRPGTEQPVTIEYDGGGGRPWKPCKSMSRCLVAAWGADAKAYAGRSVTLYRDPSVKWGGMEVGGIRISHMSHIEREMVMPLTATKGVKKAYKVKPIQAGSQEAETKWPILSPDMKVAEVRASAWLAAVRRALTALTTYERVEQWSTAMREHQAAVPEEMWEQMTAAVVDRTDALAAVESAGGQSDE